MYWALVSLMTLALLVALFSGMVTVTMSSGNLAFIGLICSIQVLWTGFAWYDHALHESATALRVIAAIFLIANACYTGVEAMRQYGTVIERSGRTRLLNIVEGAFVLAALFVLH